MCCCVFLLTRGGWLGFQRVAGAENLGEILEGDRIEYLGTWRDERAE